MKTILLSPEWETYYSNIEERLNVVKVDMMAKESKDSYPHSLFIRIDYPLQEQWPNENETAQIVKYLEHLEAALIHEKIDLKYVGSTQNNEQIDLVFVADEKHDLSSILSVIIHDPFQHSWLHNDHFSLYETLLYPSDLDLIYIYNRSLLKEYYQSHDEESHDIYFYSVFHTKKTAQDFITAVHQDFEILETILTKDLQYIVQIKRVETMSFISLNEVAVHLHHLASQFSGHYISLHYQAIQN
ncbi:DUF695 domain-containing protein [Erysipelothrix urinaevulpis]|uniref:DUF695 domain-containing protein n=1 Tax=Erysipelothrix urinaevulpis TaxID=2683717 RepID=UPI00135B5D0E|nr:DUF695 domain-containing protein [Erysipelothrix urinaevulpis]